MGRPLCQWDSGPELALHSPWTASPRMTSSRIELAHIVADGRPGGGSTMLLGLIDDLRQEPALRITVVSQPGSYVERETLRRGLPFIAFDFFRFGPNPVLPWLLARKLAPRCF